MVNLDDLEQHILAQGCFSPEENLRIYQKWFARGPRYMFRAIDQKYDMRGKVICDVGCAYGMNLPYCQPGSYGIEIDEYAVKFGNSIGFTIHARDVVSEDLSDLPKVDAVWCSAVMEHVESPHIFLRQISQLLKPDGLLAIYVPTIPLIPALRRLPFFKSHIQAYFHHDHINAFTPATLRFFCERAGFHTLEVSPFYPAPYSILNHIPYMNRSLSGCTFVGRKIPDWNYPRQATRTVTDNPTAFAYKHPHYKGAAQKD